MNRIIIIGNGFDKAHDLRTGYLDFINDYWNNFINHVVDSVVIQYCTEHSIRSYEDDYVSLIVRERKNNDDKGLTLDHEHQTSYSNLLELIGQYHEIFPYQHVSLVFKNKFFGHITNQCTLTNWLDIENEYYDALKKLLSEENSISRNAKVIALNKEFNAIRSLLEKHLTTISENTKIKKHQSIEEAFSSVVELGEIATRKKTEFIDSIFSNMKFTGDIIDFKLDKQKDPQYNIHTKEEEDIKYFITKQLKNESFKIRHCTPYTLILNFNYTKTAKKLYLNEELNIYHEVINIHGELNNPDNPLIFGYGDELDDDYKRIEKLQDNDFLENIKSINYHRTRNYRHLLELIESGIYQVFVMGHSCGNSDRTLLNTLFEHDNCASIKVFYWQQKNGIDDYSNLIRNISRNFNSKRKMRDVVVNWEDSRPLVPISKHKHPNNQKTVIPENLHV